MPNRAPILAALFIALSACSGGDGRAEERQAILDIPESARLVLPTLRDEVHVVRTEGGVPHIYARNERDLRVVQGYVTAEQRWLQIELGRRLGQGRLSEVIGTAGLANDQLTRSQGMKAVGERLLSLTSEDELAMLDAFAEGVNAYIDRVRAGELPQPSEISLLGFVRGSPPIEELMPHITGTDILGYAAVVVYQQGYETADLDRQLALDAALDAFEGVPNDSLRRAGIRSDILGHLAPLEDVTTTPGYGTERGTPARAAPRRSGIAPSMRGSLVRRITTMESLLRGERGADRGSNEWAVAGTHTASGHAILAGDGHLPLTVPSLLYHTGLDTSLFGRGDLAQLGLFFPGIPQLAVGTNGRVAWTITYLYGDLTDWFLEEVTLDGEGRPATTLRDGVQEPITAIEETYEVAEIGFLGSVGGTRRWDRYETHDGRKFMSIEGRIVEPDAAVGPGESIINVAGEYVVPEDTDDDGVIRAVTFDYTGFDVSNILHAVEGFGRARDVEEMREASRELVAFGQNVMAADVNGDIWYGSYNAMPCRDALRDGGDGGNGWADGADPLYLIDGTRYPGFEVPLDDRGFPNESDEEHCLIPFERWPMSITPESGYLVNANNDIAGLSLDGDLSNDEYHLGGPWAVGYRADTIDQLVAADAAAGTTTVASMVETQADHRSRLALAMGATFADSIALARSLFETDGPITEAQQRIVDAYTPDAARMDEVETRIRAWLARGAEAESGVATFYASAAAEEQADAVATMLWNQWLRETYHAIWDDEGVAEALAFDRNRAYALTLVRMVRGRGTGNPEGLASYDGTTEESVFFDDLSTAEVESSDEIIVAALAQALAVLGGPADVEDPAAGGFGTDDMDDWLWGLRHRVRFESIILAFAGDAEGVDLLARGGSIDTDVLPLAEGLPEDDPRAALEWFPRHGDYFAVDASNGALSGGDYDYRNGPVMRMVIEMDPDHIRGVNVLPGGQSADSDSPFFADQAALWLENETLPFRYTVGDVVAGAEGREVYTPQ